MAVASRSLEDLDSRFRPLVDQLLAKLSAIPIHITIVDTLRDEAEQRVKVSTGVSRTMRSKHLPQPPEGKSWAIDIAPTEYLGMKNWNPAGPLWWDIASAAVDLGLLSGMDWYGIGLPPVGQPRQGHELWDPSHVEYVEWKKPNDKS